MKRVARLSMNTTKMLSKRVRDLLQTYLHRSADIQEVCQSDTSQSLIWKQNE